MFVELDTVVVVAIVVFVVVREGGIVFVDSFIVTLEGVGNLVEVLKVELVFEFDIRVEVVVLVVLVDIVESAALLFVLLDVGNFMLVDEISGRKFSLVVFCKIIAEFSVVSISSTVITFSISTFFSGRFFTVILGLKFQYGLSVSGW